MSNKYFANFPEIQYEFENGTFATIKDIFRKAKIENNNLQSLISYTVYEIQEGDRPDVVSSRLYGDGDLYWTLFLVNDSLGQMSDWYRDTVTYEGYIANKYPGHAIVATNTTDIVDKDTRFALGEHCTFSGGATGRICEVDATMKRVIVIYDDSKRASAGETLSGDVSSKSFTIASIAENKDAVHHYRETSGVFSNTNNDSNTVVTNDEYERELNENKRKINVIEPQYIRQVVREFESIMSI